MRVLVEGDKSNVYAMGGISGVFQMESNKSGIQCGRCHRRIQKGEWFKTDDKLQYAHARHSDANPCTAEINATVEEAVVEEVITIEEQKA